MMKPLTFATFSLVLMHGLCLLNAPNSFAEEVAIPVTQDDPTKVRDRVFAKCEVYGELEAIVHIAKRENLGKRRQRRRWRIGSSIGKKITRIPSCPLPGSIL